MFIKQLSKFAFNEEGFVFTATATVVSVILGLTILFMANTIRTETVRVAELHSGQDAYWQAISDVQMAANMIQYNGTGILPHLSSYFPNITVTQTDQTNMVVSSYVTLGNSTAGAQRGASIGITSPIYSIVEQVGGTFDITGFSEVDGGNLYIGGDVRIQSFWGFPLARVGRDSTVNFFVPTGNSVNPTVGQGGNDYTVTNVAPITMPGFDATAYTTLLNYASNISADNPAVGEWYGPTTLNASTHPAGLDLQNISYTGGGILNGLGKGIFVNGDLKIDGTTFNILDNNTASDPGFIIVDGKLEIEGPWFMWLPAFEVPDNVIILTTGKIDMNWANFGESASYPSNTWPNYVNEIYTLSSIHSPKWTFGSEMFGQFHVLGNVSQIGWLSKMSGVVYAPNSPYDFGTLFGAFPQFDGTFYVRKGKRDQISWLADINLDSRARLGRGLPGGLVQPSAIPWVVKEGSLQEI